MSSDRLPRICFNRTRELSNASGTPIGFIKKLTNLLNNNGSPALVSCDDPETLRSAITGLLKTAADQSIQNDLTRMDKSKLYSHYKDIHISFMTEGYLLGDFPLPVVRLLAQSNREFENRAAIIVALRAGRSPKEIVDFLKLPKTTIYRVKKQFDEADSNKEGIATRKKHSRRSDRVRGEEFVKNVKEKIDGNPGKSMRAIAKEMDVGSMTIVRTIHEDLGLKSYALRKGQLLTENMKNNRKGKAAALLNNLKHDSFGMLRFFSDEKNFDVDQKVNPRNDRWICKDPSEKPVVMHTKFPASVMVLGVISSEGDVMPPHFFEKGLRMNTDTYINVLETVVKPWMDIWWPQEGNCNPLDYYVWGVVERDVNKAPHTTIQSVKKAVHTVMTQMDKVIVAKACASFRTRLETVISYIHINVNPPHECVADKLAKAIIEFKTVGLDQCPVGRHNLFLRSPCPSKAAQRSLGHPGFLLRRDIPADGPSRRSLKEFKNSSEFAKKVLTRWLAHCKTELFQLYCRPTSSGIIEVILWLSNLLRVFAEVRPDEARSPKQGPRGGGYRSTLFTAEEKLSCHVVGFLKKLAVISQQLPLDRAPRPPSLLLHTHYPWTIQDVVACTHIPFSTDAIRIAFNFKSVETPGEGPMSRNYPNEFVGHYLTEASRLSEPICELITFDEAVSPNPMEIRRLRHHLSSWNI
ncbi:hypothetical protein LAZ67_5002908 [Cordylochernes scorpioides]|uniref:Transposase n=1 Tax=Cordylochernes scorpioides TaxID=51811 RepID=A0ABY6KHV5_9ARAC|nr:hypothetical protein LAZ67_5002908 [Cordylochernes scorpioides]